MIKPGDPIFVPKEEAAMAHSFGAVMVEGDARLFIPNILPEGVSVETFRRWSGEGARLIWIGEFLEGIVGGPVDLMNLAGLISENTPSKQSRYVPLYVPSFEMDRVRHIPGVHWDRGQRIYVADESADFLLVHRYLTPAMRAAWVSDRNMDIAMASMVKARALMESMEDGDQAGEVEIDQD